MEKKRDKQYCEHSIRKRFQHFWAILAKVKLNLYTLLDVSVSSEVYNIFRQHLNIQP